MPADRPNADAGADARRCPDPGADRGAGGRGARAARGRALVRQRQPGRARPPARAPVGRARDRHVRRQTALTVKDYGYWDDAVQHLVLDLDPEWADGNVGAYIHDTFGYEYSFVLDGADRTIYAADRRRARRRRRVRRARRRRSAAWSRRRAPPRSPPTSAACRRPVLLAGDGWSSQRSARCCRRRAPSCSCRPARAASWSSPSGSARSSWQRRGRLRPAGMSGCRGRGRRRAARVRADLADRRASSATRHLAAAAARPAAAGLAAPALLGALLVFLGFAGVALRNVQRAAARDPGRRDPLSRHRRGQLRLALGDRRRASGRVRLRAVRDDHRRSPADRFSAVR